MSQPDPLYLRWRGQDVRIRHDDPLLNRLLRRDPALPVSDDDHDRAREPCGS
jgi:hypothetical protein